MKGRYGDLDYSRLTVLSFSLGLGMFLAGELGEVGLRTAGMSVPAWEHRLFLALAGVGILIAFLSPFVFGIALPLTE
ncbi:hypothetical protein [Halorubrum sp. HHNYT27]|uniref:DUF7860 family protein n=1 Tax=Halorubrum sp. HHNYT27 TaxID=3402275 RepID=UPI003EC08E63